MVAISMPGGCEFGVMRGIALIFLTTLHTSKLDPVQRPFDTELPVSPVTTQASQGPHSSCIIKFPVFLVESEFFCANFIDLRTLHMQNLLGRHFF